MLEQQGIWTGYTFNPHDTGKGDMVDETDRVIKQ